ncbi:MAG: hydrolase, partial [Anaerolineae bacterium]|nr:hydrolase [Anaerolineae bacterium]
MSGMPGGSWQAYDVVVQKNVRVPMRDGITLAADLYLPAIEGQVAPGRYPVVLERTPYDKEGRTNEGRYFARHG